ncbi:hypothetical protein PAMP_009291 [Pampus punctatissimus]
MRVLKPSCTDRLVICKVHNLRGSLMGHVGKEQQIPVSKGFIPERLIYFFSNYQHRSGGGAVPV